MELDQLRNFVRIAESGSLTRASTVAWKSQSALSRQLQDMEREFGVVLFERRARGLELTEAGQWVLDRSRHLLSEADSLKANAAAMGTEPKGPLVIGSPPSLGSMLVADFAESYLRRFPAVSLHLREGTSRSMRDALGRGELDLAILSSVEPLETFRKFPVLTESLCLVGPAKAKLDMKRASPVSTLLRGPVVLTARPNSLRRIVDEGLAARGLKIEPIAEAETVSMALDLVRRNMGSTVLPYCAIHTAISTGELSATRLAGLNISWVICESMERPQTAASRTARELLLQLSAHQLRKGRWLTAQPARPQSCE